ncbi:ATP-binding protein [Campylobacter sp. JMF_03 NE3]|uniref:ATP-binding protein n=1 Tax=Campylobacter sp. JMF_03 NE3 TaxID=2983831 RepID=UPI0022E9B699|nr:ATP-binding protein [Campylobacter sp. JMF_03 NE3]MDA3053610.1 ATP-binding protein [Campylobacter sp. JMF_03 NE3]
MRYLIVEDEYYYTEQGKEDLAAKYDTKKENLIVALNKEIIDAAFLDNSIVDKVFMSPYLPETLDKKFTIFETIRVSNKYGLLTKKQYEEKVAPAQILRDKLQCNIYAPNFTFNDYIIDKNNDVFRNLIDSLKILRSRKASGIICRGYFLTGIPGTGKTFFAKCISGELNMPLVELNLSYFINHDNTFGLLKNFFNFFKYTEGEYIILLDEIEKMFNGTPKAQQVLGQLLTTLNEYASINNNNKADVIFIATANNITDLVANNPELFRKGRFDKSIYLTAPQEDKAKDTFVFYQNKFSNNFKKSIIPFLFFMAFSDKEKKKYQLIETSRINEIFEIIKNDTETMKIIEEYIEDESVAVLADNLRQTLLFEFLTKHATINNMIEKIVTDFNFNLDINQIIIESFSVWREKLETNASLFPYVPAEIESMVGELFEFYYFGRKDEINTLKYIRENIPLQISMSNGIKNMNAATENFLKL